MPRPILQLQLPLRLQRTRDVLLHPPEGGAHGGEHAAGALQGCFDAGALLQTVQEARHPPFLVDMGVVRRRLLRARKRL